MGENVRLVYNIGKFRVYFEYDEKIGAFRNFYCAVLSNTEVRSSPFRLTHCMHIDEVVKLMKKIESNPLLKTRLRFVNTASELRNLLGSTINGYLSRKEKGK